MLMVVEIDDVFWALISIYLAMKLGDVSLCFSIAISLLCRLPQMQSIIERHPTRRRVCPEVA